MRVRPLLNRLGRYGLVGMVAAAVHLAVLLGLSAALPIWIANPLAFLAASLAGYVGHAMVTFREETGGKRFARRWLVLQYAVNLAVCAMLPLLLGAWAAPLLRTTVLVFTPTVLNAVIWSRAARFSARQRRVMAPPRIHADDFGLAEGVDEAILALAQDGLLDGASLLVEGPTATAAAARWRTLPKPLTLCLHLCLTEGPESENCPDLPASFGQLLLASVLPSRRRRLKPQIARRIDAQINRYRALTGLREINVDGHQHIHLVPIVLDCLLLQADIHWIRTTAEPLPTGLPLKSWVSAVRDGGLLKWLVLRVLTGLARPRLQKRSIHTNARFAGVLFTGRMSGAELEAAESCLNGGDLLLAHPAAEGSSRDLARHGFELSETFFRSPWRQREWQALRARAPRG